MRIGRSSVQSKLFVSFIAVVLVPSLIIGLSSYFVSLGILKEKVSASFSETVVYIRNSVEKELAQIKQFSDFIFVNDSVNKVLTTVYAADERYAQLKDLEAVDRVLKDYALSRADQNLQALKLFTLRGDMYSFEIGESAYYLDDEAIAASPGYREAWDRGGIIVWQPLAESLFRPDKREADHSLSFYRTIRNLTYQNNIGLMYVNFDKRIFTYLLNRLDLKYDSQIYIVNNYGEVMNAPRQQAEFERIAPLLADGGANAGGSRYAEDRAGGNLVVSYAIPEWDWQVVGTIPVAELTRDNARILLVTAVAFFIGFLFSCVLWYFVSYRIVLPIKRLSKTMSHVMDGNLNVRAAGAGVDEIGRLSDHFNYMLERINALFKEVVHENTRKKDAEYRALQAQINPHFLYNTLNSIRWMAIIHKADNIKRVVDALARLLKYSTGKTGNIVCVRDEVDSLNDYFYIQQLAYKHKFDVEWAIEEETLGLKCMRFLLQPIVENAIFHGIEPKEGFGTIRVMIRSENGNLLLTVRDDGVGMTAEQAAMLLNRDETQTRGFSGVGVRNVHERLRMAHGETYGLRIESEPGRYTEVTAVMPAEAGVLAHDENNDRG